MKKRIWAVLLAALMVAAVFAGCGSEPVAPSEGGESGGTAAPSEGGSEEPYDVTFMYVVGSDHPDQAKVEEAMKALVLEELFGVEIPGEALDDFETVEDMVGYIEDRM